MRHDWRADLAHQAYYRTSVGADGIAVSWFGRKRFIGYDEIREVERFDVDGFVGGYSWLG